VSIVIGALALAIFIKIRGNKKELG
jgi:hypothetical protein